MWTTKFTSYLPEERTTPRNGTSCQTALCLLYGKEGEGEIPLTYAEAERKEELALELIHIMEKVNPGQSRLRGVLLYELQTAILRKAQLDVEKRILKPPEWRQLAQTCMDYLRESAEVLQREPSVTSERFVAERAVGELTALTRVLAAMPTYSA